MAKIAGERDERGCKGPEPPTLGFEGQPQRGASEGDADPKLIEQPAPSSALRPAERAPRDKRRKTPEKR